jgi:hypothetical protein
VKSRALDEETGIEEFFISHPGDEGRDGSKIWDVHTLMMMTKKNASSGGARKINQWVYEFNSIVFMESLPLMNSNYSEVSNKIFDSAKTQ